jgi:fido (protein-threonine AMPylation protein)
MTPRQRDEQEMRNGVEVMTWIDHLTAHPDVSLDLNLVCYFNKLVLQNTDRDQWAGRPRSTVDWQAPGDWSRPRAIVSPEEPGLAVADIETGELLTHFPPDHEVGALLDDLLEWVHSTEAQALTAVERAAIFHHEFTRIHPFRDGNGRTARALMTLMLRREGFDYEVLVLQRLFDESRKEYINALRRADEGDLTPWVEFLVETLQAAMLETARLLSQTTEEDES